MCIQTASPAHLFVHIQCNIMDIDKCPNQIQDNYPRCTMTAILRFEITYVTNTNFPFSVWYPGSGVVLDCIDS